MSRDAGAGSVVVRRSDWVHGLVPCPNCGQLLDKERDDGEFLWSVMESESKAYGVEGTHERCGVSFTLTFNDVRLPADALDRRRGRAAGAARPNALYPAPRL